MLAGTWSADKPPDCQRTILGLADDVCAATRPYLMAPMGVGPIPPDYVRY
jgi:hypothetical protein